MTFTEYQKEAVKFRTESANNEEYLTLGLIEEVGEAAGKLAKRRRDGVFDEKAFIKELGDILWFVANLADYWDKNEGFAYAEFIKGRDFYIAENNLLTQREMLMVLVGDVALFIEESLETQLVGIITDVGILAKTVGYTLEQVMEINLAKLRDRLSRGVINGNGDER